MLLEELTTLINLGSIERIPLGEGRDFVIDNKEIAIFRTRNGRIFAVDAKCPHRNGPLADGILGGSTIVCPYHSYKFELTTGQPVGHDCSALKTYPVEVSATGDILLTWG
ncbi:MAG TPA: Rieske 2Fe-2S domain-containing protein [Blastocatellia bacterium]|nr:Rieske 2Fe-2S domain-containing protein [Blastocatellia bacterium]